MIFFCISQQVFQSFPPKQTYSCHRHTFAFFFKCWIRLIDLIIQCCCCCFFLSFIVYLPVYFGSLAPITCYWHEKQVLFQGALKVLRIYWVLHRFKPRNLQFCLISQKNSLHIWSNSCLGFYMTPLLSYNFLLWASQPTLSFDYFDYFSFTVAPRMMPNNTMASFLL